MVPDENVLGPVGQGYKIAIETLNEGRIGIGAQMIGVARGALEAATAYVKERRQFGKAIAEFQGVQFQLAQMATDLEAARLMVYNAARLKDAGQPFAQQAAMAKLFSSQVADRITSSCLELFGGLRVLEGVSGGEVLSRRQDRDDLRGNQQHAAADDREGAAEVGWRRRQETRPSPRCEEGRVISVQRSRGASIHVLLSGALAESWLMPPVVSFDQPLAPALSVGAGRLECWYRSA